MSNMNIDLLRSKLEFLAEQVHNSWWEEKKKQGFHAPNECMFYSKLNGTEEKFTKHCDKCHADMYPYDELADNIQEYDRVTVKTVLDAIEKL